MKRIIAAALACLTWCAVSAQEKVYLWPNKVGPGSEKVKAIQTVAERSPIPGRQNRAVSGVTEPYYEVFAPSASAANTQRSLLVIPGGAYQRVVIDTEGYDYVQGYTDAGYTVFVLTYRTPNDGHKNASLVPLQDAQRAMRLIRANAEAYGISPFRIGVMGSSAGGHVAASLATRFGEETYKPVDSADKDKDGNWTSAKPAFQFLIYPVITMQDGTHAGSRTALLGAKPSEKDKDAASCEQLVTAATPPAFIVCATDDKSVPPYTNAIAYWKAMSDKSAKCELHIFPESGHGFGVLNAYGTAAQWQPLSIEWLKTYLK
ncbi:MAG: alpha/beta hydrolase [Treponema sp.]|nr:alpha/beta hydrolase [Treponema sp.]